MDRNTEVQRINLKILHDTYLLTSVESFLIDRIATGLSSGGITFYQKKLRIFTDYCETQVITQVTEITPNVIRRFLLYLKEKGHNPGGVHACYRSLRAFLNWWEIEYELSDWRNPIAKVKAPKVPEEVLDPVEIKTVKAMVAMCERGTFYGDRDRAILLCLLDTGARASEFLDIDLSDLELVSGAILIRQGKGRKPRTVFIGKRCKKVIRFYLRHREDSSQALWVTRQGGRMSYDTLRGVITRRAEAAGVDRPTAHDFRRAFALTMSRNGVDIYTLAKLMGHSSITVLKQYLKQTTEDTQLAHRQAGPVDNW